ncbi:MAG: hypothetical protein ACK50E_08185, partial [Bacteroidota bacterium]
MYKNIIKNKQRSRYYSFIRSKFIVYSPTNNHMRLSFILIVCLLFINTKPRAQSLFENIKGFTKFDSLAGTNTPERKWWDVVMYDLDMEPDMNKFSITGSNRVLFLVVEKPATRMQIDLQQPMQIDSAKLNGKPVTYTRENNFYFINIDKD